MNKEEMMKALQRPFPSAEIEWRIQRTNASRTSCFVLAYLTARAVQDRLDEVFGPGGWSTSFTPVDTKEEGFLCKLSVLIDGEWVSKVDGAPFTAVEPLKGGISDAFKRAAVQFGIGRYLYWLENKDWVPLYEEKPASSIVKTAYVGKDRYYFIPPTLPNEFIPQDEWSMMDKIRYEEAQRNKENKNA